MIYSNNEAVIVSSDWELNIANVKKWILTYFELVFSLEIICKLDGVHSVDICLIPVSCYVVILSILIAYKSAHREEHFIFSHLFMIEQISCSWIRISKSGQEISKGLHNMFHKTKVKITLESPFKYDLHCKKRLVIFQVPSRDLAKQKKQATHEKFYF